MLKGNRFLMIFFVATINGLSRTDSADKIFSISILVEASGSTALVE